MHIRSDKILLADISESFRNMYLNIYELDPGKFLSAPGLAWQAALKKTKAKLDLLTYIDILLKLMINTWKIVIKIKNYHILNIEIRIIYMAGQYCKNFQ